MLRTIIVHVIKRQKLLDGLTATRTLIAAVCGNVMLIRKNERILKEIRRCNHDLGLALSLAAQARYREAETAARRWASRMRAHMAGETYRRPEPVHTDDEWRSRFAP